MPRARADSYTQATIAACWQPSDGPTYSVTSSGAVRPGRSPAITWGSSAGRRSAGIAPRAMSPANGSHGGETRTAVAVEAGKIFALKYVASSVSRLAIVFT